MKEHGMEVVHEHVGREPSGRAFNELAAEMFANSNKIPQSNV